MPKRKRREQQHMGQQSTKRRSYTIGSTAPNEVFKPGFPMNLFGNLKLFSIIGVVIVAILVGSAVLTNRGSDQGDRDAVPTATPTPTVDPNATQTPTVSVTATATASTKTFPAADQVIDAATKNYSATIKTSKGDITLKLNADIAPNTVNSFVFLAQKGYFDNTIIHRVVKDFVVQGGDAAGTGSGSPGYKTADEPNKVANKRGTVSMAKTSGASDFGSQFFVNLKDNASLDFNNPTANKFYPFAEVTKGLEVVDAIAAVAVNGSKRPNEPITITKVEITETAK